MRADRQRPCATSEDRKGTASHSSHWCLLTSAADDRAACAAGTSLLAGLLAGPDVELAVTPYFKGGFQVEFVLDHEGDVDAVEAAVLAGVDRVCVEWARTDEGAGPLSLWSHVLNIPRVETLRVVVRPGVPG